MSAHEPFNPPELAPATGFSHAVKAGEGRLVFFGGQTALDENDEIVGETFVEQFDKALANLVIALRASDGEPEHLVQVQIFVTDAQAYRDARRELGRVWKQHLGRWYPAMAMFEVKGLLDPKALVELMAVAVVP